MKRIHMHVGVEDVTESVSFYSVLFGAPPSVQETDYAKWMLEDPRLNFAISAGHTDATGIERVGIQVENEEELAEIRQRFDAAQAVTTFDEPETNCCYANSSKTWAKDPQNVIWETFHTMEQIENYGQRPQFSASDAPVPEPTSTPSNCC